jgi:hypothetical protein
MAAWMWAIAGLVAGSAGMVLVMRARAMAEVTSALAQHANGLRARMEAIDARHQHNAPSMEDNALTVVTCPYQDTLGDKGWWSDSRRVESGYLFQLFVNGAPCLAPHKVPLQVLVQADATPARLEAATKSALQLTESMAAFHPRIRAVRDVAELKKRVFAD